jgi:hypothetical protein
MFQTNSVAIRAERWINWKRRRTAAVAVISGVNYGSTRAAKRGRRAGKPRHIAWQKSDICNVPMTQLRAT